MEPRARSYVLMDLTRIDLSFQFRGVELLEGDEIRAVFSRVKSYPGDDQQAAIRLEWRNQFKHHALRNIGNRRPHSQRQGPGHTVPRAGRVCLRRGCHTGRGGRDWPFINKAELGLVIVLLEQPSYMAWLQGSKFVFDSQG